MNRTVVVEQEYNPEIMDASKVNVLPKVEEPTVIKKEVEYAVSAVPASNIPMETMQVYTGIEAQPMSKPGYIRLGYGNYNNLDVYANYLFHLSGRDKLNVNFNMTGMSGKLEVPYEEGFKWNAHYYRTRANVDYLHQFKKVDLNVAGHFGLSNFNYEPNTMPSGNQKFTSGDIHFGAKSTDETMPLQFHAETNLMLYNRRDYLSHGEITETQVRTYADVRGKINDEQQIAIGLTMNNLIYSNDAKKNAFKQYFKEKYDDRTTLNLNPYYELMDDSWHLHLGANVDGSFGGGKKLRVSPDVSIQFIFSDSYVLYAPDSTATVVGEDDTSDVAVLKIDATGLTPATVGDSDSLSVGDSVLAVGNPLGELGGTVTSGIVSALNRSVTIQGTSSTNTMSLIQMDASVSPGNSGGGLFNMNGELIGLVNAKSSSSDAEGLGFAIPINDAIQVAQDLLENGYVSGRPYMGITYIAVTDAQTAAQFNVNAYGVYVVDVVQGGPADKAGLKVGDRIVSIDGTEIAQKDDLGTLMQQHTAGDTLSITVARDGQMQTVSLTLGEKNASNTAAQRSANN